MSALRADAKHWMGLCWSDADMFAFLEGLGGCEDVQQVRQAVANTSPLQRSNHCGKLMKICKTPTPV